LVPLLSLLLKSRTKAIKPLTAPPILPTPTVPSHSHAAPPVTGDLGVPSDFTSLLQPPVTTTQLATMPAKDIRFLMDKMGAKGEDVPLSLMPCFTARWKFLREGLASAIEGETQERDRKRRRQ
jgi:hypothetical protein